MAATQLFDTKLAHSDMMPEEESAQPRKLEVHLAWSILDAHKVVALSVEYEGKCLQLNDGGPNVWFFVQRCSAVGFTRLSSVDESCIERHEACLEEIRWRYNLLLKESE